MGLCPVDELIKMRKWQWVAYTLRQQLHCWLLHAVESAISRWPMNEMHQEHMAQNSGGGMQASQEVLKSTEAHFSKSRTMARTR